MRTLIPVDLEQDARLVANVILGIQPAQREFAQRFGKLFQVIAGRYFRDAGASDAAQEIFEKICKNDWAVLRQWDGHGALPAYLASVSRNVCLDTLRRRRAETGIDEVDEESDDRPDPEMQAAASELARCLKSALDALS